MPTILRFRSFRIQIFTDDHGPPHIHAMGPGVSISFFLHCPGGPVTLRSAERIRKTDENALATFLNAHLKSLCKGWEKLHDQPKRAR